MWAFQYKHGDRPLEGFTIQRAAGRGGFGEVYYAVSDSGREVALKVVQGYEQIELRGISQCMNLKSPHLVTIFDVKYNEQNKPFVIMEFVSGPSLRQLLDESPSGLGDQKSAFFLREIAKGLSYLHDCGIVHRDLKPANIFYENGYVKIGDYGLSKMISTTQHSGQTVTVGTVHYMAPEIGAGRYDRSIDIYALGAVLYEMITGMPPFVGASATEVLMKHLSVEPDCTNIKEPFATVIRKAMHKDPAQRYQSVQEMVEAVFGAEHVRQSVSAFSPQELSMVAGRVAGKVGVGGPGSGGSVGIGTGAYVSSNKSSSVTAQPAARGDLWTRLAGAVDRAAESGGRFVFGSAGQDRVSPAAPDEPVDPLEVLRRVDDPLSATNRRMMALAVSFIGALIAGVWTAQQGPVAFAYAALTLLSSWAAATAILLAHVRLMPRLHKEAGVVRYVAMAGIVGGPMLLAGILPYLAIAATTNASIGVWIAMLAPLVFMNTLAWIRPDREERVTVLSAFLAGLFGFIVSAVIGGSSRLAITVPATVALIVMLLSPWSPTLAKRRAEAGEEEEEESTYGKEIAATVEKSAGEKGFTASGTPVPPPIPGADGMRDIRIGPLHIRASDHRVDINSGGTSKVVINRSGVADSSIDKWWHKSVPHAVRFVWFVGVALFIPMGIALLVFAGNIDHWEGTSAAALVGGGVASLVMGLFSLARVFTIHYLGIWNYLLRGITFCIALWILIGISVALGYEPYTPVSTLATCVFLIVFSAIVLLGTLAIPGKWLKADYVPPEDTATESQFSRTVTLVLASVFFFTGIAGLHRFYTGRIPSAIIWLLTFGLFGIGQLVDLIMLVAGVFKDGEGRAVTRWEGDGASYVRRESAIGVAAAPSAATPGNNVHVTVDEKGGVTIDPASLKAAGVDCAPALGIPCGDDSAKKKEDQLASPFGDFKGLFGDLGIGNARSKTRASANWRRSPILAGILSMLAAAALFLAMLTGLARALDVPTAIENGLPHPDVRAEIEKALRNVKVSDSGGYKFEFDSSKLRDTRSGRGGMTVVAPPAPPAARPVQVPFIPDVPDVGDVTGPRGMPTTSPVVLHLQKMEQFDLVMRRMGNLSEIVQRRIAESTDPKSREVVERALADIYARNPKLIEQIQKEMIAADKQRLGAVRENSFTSHLSLSSSEPLAEQWPSILRGGLTAVATTLWIIAFVLLVMARRYQGGLHIVRGVFAIALLVSVTLGLQAAFEPLDVWPQVAVYTQLNNPEAAWNAFAAGWSRPGLTLSAIAFGLGVIVMAWPAARAAQRRIAA